MSEPKDIPGAGHDPAIADLLEDLGGAGLPNGGEPDEGVEPAELRREYLETLGLLPWSLDPLPPRREGREALLAAVAAAPERSARVVPARNRWLLPLAAALVLALGAVLLWQNGRIARQADVIAELSSRLGEAETLSAEAAEQRRQLELLQGRLAIVASAGVEVCALRPVGERPLLPASRGTLFVMADHQHWYLSLEGLGASPEGKSYQVWFITRDSVPVSAGTFDGSPGERVELSSPTMPGGTRAVSVTLEPAGGSEQPSGPPVLYGDEVMRII